MLCNSGVLKVFQHVILFSLTVFSALRLYFLIIDHYFKDSLIPSFFVLKITLLYFQILFLV